MDDAAIDAKLAEIPKVDYERIGERMFAELVYVNYAADTDKDRYVEIVKKAAALNRTLILGCKDVELAKAALEVCKEAKPVLNGADASNYAEMSAVATEAGVVLGVTGKDLNELYDTVAALEKAGNKNLILDVGTASIKEAYGNAVQIRRAAVKDQDRTFGYPTLVNVAALAHGDRVMQQALLSMFTMKYGSIVVVELCRGSSIIWIKTERIYSPTETNESRTRYLRTQRSRRKLLMSYNCRLRSYILRCFR